jgi:outer membrane murein-binding lipoprotein Lpp
VGLLTIFSSAEIEDAAATVRQTKVYLDTLEQKEKEVRAQVNAARAAIDAANSIAEQTRVDSPEEAARLKGMNLL